MLFRSKYIGIELEFRGEGIEEKGYLININKELFIKNVGEEYLNDILNRVGETLVSVDARYFRPTEVELLIGDPTKSKSTLNWEPEFTLETLCEDMMKSDIHLMKKDAYLLKGGYKPLNNNE